MTITSQVDEAIVVASSSPNGSDVQLESALRRMTLGELEALQDALLGQLRAGLPPVARLAEAIECHDREVAAWLRSRGRHDDAAKVVMLLGVLAVAIAWLRYRRVPAPASRLQDAIETMSQDHFYMLPIPRNDPCFCGSGGRFRGCHGKVPHATTLAASARANR